MFRVYGLQAGISVISLAGGLVMLADWPIAQHVSIGDNLLTLGQTQIMDCLDSLVMDDKNTIRVVGLFNAVIRVYSGI